MGGGQEYIIVNGTGIAAASPGGARKWAAASFVPDFGNCPLQLRLWLRQAVLLWNHDSRQNRGIGIGEMDQEKRKLYQDGVPGIFGAAGGSLLAEPEYQRRRSGVVGNYGTF